MATYSKPLHELKAAHCLLKEYNYELLPTKHGYANRTLYIDLRDYSIKEKPVTQHMKDIFTGGRGFARSRTLKRMLLSAKASSSSTIFSSGV